MSEAASPQMGRRAFCKTVGLSAAAAVGATGATGGVSAGTIDRPISATMGGTIGVQYVGGRIRDALVGDSRDYSGYIGEDALHKSIAEGILELESADERVLTSIENNIEYSANVALSEGKAGIIEEMNAGEDESVAQDRMEEEIDEYYSGVQENIINHWNAQVDQFMHYVESVENHENISDDEVFTGNGDPSEDFQVNEADYELVDGSTKKYKYIHFDQIDGGARQVDPLSYEAEHNDDLQNTPGIEDPDTGDNLSWSGTVTVGPRYRERDDEDEPQADPDADNIWERLLGERDQVYADLSGFVTDVYDYWEPGEIPTEEIVDPITAATELQQDYDGYQAQGAFASMIGIPTSAEQSLYLELKEDDTTVWADIYTEHVPNEGEDDEGFNVGSTYDPSDWDAPLYIAYEHTDEDGEVTSDFAQIEQEFEILDGVDRDGEEIESFQTTSRNHQTSDVESIQEELDQIREAQLEMQEDAQSSGGGGGLFGDGLSWPDFGVGGIVGSVVGGVGALVVVGFVVILAVASSFAGDSNSLE